jgi:hypothetical protein
MKLLLLFVLLIGLGSCQSEYDLQMSKAKLLKTHIESKLKCCDKQSKLKLKREYKIIAESIKFHARMSGNSENFLKEVNLIAFNN